MSRLRMPLREVIRPALEERDVARLWSGVERRRGANQTRLWHQPRAWTVAFAVAALALVAAASRMTLSHHSSAKPLLMKDGTPLSSEMSVFGDSSQSIELSDRSSITIGGGVRLSTLKNDGDSVVLIVDGGLAEFEVTPGGDRRWTIACGPAAVDITGTRFAITCFDDRAKVRVTSGSVLVRGQEVPHHAVRLAAGESIEVKSAQAIAPLASVSTAAEPVGSSPAAVSVHRLAPMAPATVASSQSWQTLATQGDHKMAYEALGPGGIQSRSSSADADELFALADVARYSGHPIEAVAPLQRIVASHSGNPRAPLAAFTLGRLYQENLRRPAEAIRLYSLAIGLGLPPSLREDALSRSLELVASIPDAAVDPVRASDAGLDR